MRRLHQPPSRGWPDRAASSNPTLSCCNSRRAWEAAGAASVAQAPGRHRCRQQLQRQRSQAGRRAWGPGQQAWIPGCLRPRPAQRTQTPGWPSHSLPSRPRGAPRSRPCGPTPTSGAPSARSAQTAAPAPRRWTARGAAGTGRAVSSSAAPGTCRTSRAPAGGRRRSCGRAPREMSPGGPSLLRPAAERCMQMAGQQRSSCSRGMCRYPALTSRRAPGPCPLQARPCCPGAPPPAAEAGAPAPCITASRPARRCRPCGWSACPPASSPPLAPAHHGLLPVAVVGHQVAAPALAVHPGLRPAQRLRHKQVAAGLGAEEGGVVGPGACARGFW